MKQSMLMALRLVSTVLMVGFLFTASSWAQVVISLSESGSNNIDVGAAGPAQTLDFYIGQTPGSGTSLGAAVATFRLEQGNVPLPENTEIFTGIAPTGPDTGFFGGGNIFDSRIQVQGANSTDFLVNQAYNSTQLLSDNPQLWFSIEVDLTGAPVGTHSISLLAPSESFQSGTGDFLTASNNLTFTVTAVPEPSSMCFITSLGTLLIVRRHRRC